MSLINVQEWSIQQVADWISGLDPSLSAYGSDFVNKKVNGAKLLNLMAGDLERIGVDKVGDQLLLHDAIQSLRNEMESDRVTLQTLASQLCVRCKNYRSELSNLPKNMRIPTDSLATAAYLLDASKTLLRWMTRFPFLGNIEYDNISQKLSQHCFELALLSQRDSFADNPAEEVQYLCTKMIELCDYMIMSKDSLVLQPTAGDVITLRKRHEQDLGLQFESSYFGLHVVSGVTLNSPAQQSGHLERGDEILQINYQTVVGWTQQSVISVLHENPCEVNLTIKRRPRHASNTLGHMYLRPNRVPHRKVVSPVIEEAPDKEMSNPQEFFFPSDSKDVVNPPKEENEKTENEEPVPVASNAETRFWKLYPRSKTLLRRRATVSGASPTSTRPPVTFVDDGPSSSRKRPPLDKSKSESNKLDIDDQSLRLFVGDSNVKGSRVTLPLMDNLTINSKPPDVVAPVPVTVKVKVQPEIVEPKPRPKEHRLVPTVVLKSPADSPIIPELKQEIIQEPPPAIPPPPIYTGYLHERAQWKFGPRWNRFKCTLYPKLLVVGSHSFRIGKDDYRIALAVEVHSRPFAFKLEQCRANQEKSVVYVAAESQREMEMWIRKLSKETEQPYPLDSNGYPESGPGAGTRSYRRSFSLQSPIAPEKPRRSSLPPKHEFSKVSPKYKVPLRTDIGKLKSHSTTRLDEKRFLSSTATPPLYHRSNISSITITSSVKRGSDDFSDSTPSPNSPKSFVPERVRSTNSLGRNLKHTSTYNPVQIPNQDLSCSPFEMNLDGRGDRRHSHSGKESKPNNTGTPKMPASAAPAASSPVINQDFNRNECLVSCCHACGSRLNVKTSDVGSQTDDNLFILIQGDHQSNL